MQGGKPPLSLNKSGQWLFGLIMFAFLLVIPKVNTNYREAEFGEEEEPKPMLQFHRALSSNQINQSVHHYARTKCRSKEKQEKFK
eukprot:15338310-Ditylum_brightwellii.AAC.1